MLSLSQTTGYAILAMSCLDAPEGSPASVPNVAACTRIPRPYLSKVFQILAAKGFVKTKRGFKGGVMLSRPPEEFTLWEIAEAIEKPGWIGDCLLGIPQCTGECPTHDFWNVERARIEAHLRSITLRDMADYRSCRLYPHHLETETKAKEAEADNPETAPVGVGWCSGEETDY